MQVVLKAGLLGDAELSSVIACGHTAASVSAGIDNARLNVTPGSSLLYDGSSPLLCQ